MAAESMYISQPTISLRIRTLEKELNTVLFERNGGKKAILTSEGKKIYPYYKEGFRWLLKGNEVLQTKNQIFGKIRLSCPNHMGQLILPTVLKTLYEYYPDIDFNVKVRTTSEIVKDIKKGETDVGLVHLDLDEENESYTIIPISMEKTVLVASPNHPLVKRSPSTFKILDLKEEKFIVFSKTSNAQVIVDQFLNKHGLKEYNTIEVSNLEWIKTMVTSGLGISFLQKNTVKEELKNHKLIEVSLTEPLPTTPISIIFRNEVPGEIRCTITKTMKDLLSN